MSTKQVQIRRDTASNLASATPAAGELGYNTTDMRLVIGDGATAGGVPHTNFFDVQSNYWNYADDGGTANSYTAALPKKPSSLRRGVVVIFYAANTNTGPSQLTVNDFSAKDIYKLTSGAIGALEANDIIAGMIYQAAYDGTRFILLNSGFTQGTAISSGGLNLVAIGTASAGTIDFLSLYTSTYDNYMYLLTGVTPGANSSGQDLYFRVQKSGSGTFEAGSNNYGSDAFDATQSGTETRNQSASTLMRTAKALTSTLGCYGTVHSYDVNQTSKRKHFDWNLTELESSANAGGNSWSRGRGMYTNTFALSGMRFGMAAGSNGITAGTIYCYGYNKSM